MSTAVRSIGGVIGGLGLVVGIGCGLGGGCGLWSGRRLLIGGRHTLAHVLGCAAMGQRVHIVIAGELLARIDAAVEETETPRARWIARACEQRLTNDAAGLALLEDAERSLVDIALPVRPSPMVGETTERALRGSGGPQLYPRSSSQSKSGVRPIPKGKP